MQIPVSESTSSREVSRWRFGNGVAGKLLLCYCFTTLLFLVEFSQSQLTQTNILTQGQELTNGCQLISATGTFVLDFYEDIYEDTYLAISYSSGYENPVWIANRESPFNNSESMSLTIDANGSLKIVGHGYSFSLFDVEQPTNSSAILQEDGNFVLRELNPNGSVKRVLWQSFDHPTDTLLPGMKLGINHKTGSTWSLTSWRSVVSAEPGAFTLAMDPNNTYQLHVLLRGAPFWRSGNWKFTSFEFFRYQEINLHRFSNENETYFICLVPKFYQPFTYASLDMKGNFKPPEVLPQLRLGSDGVLKVNDQNSHSICDVNFRNDDDDDDDDDDPYGYDRFSEEGCVWGTQQKIPECRSNSYLHWTNGYMGGNGTKYQEFENLTMFECKNICISDCDCIAVGDIYGEDSGCKIWKSGEKKFTSSGQLVWYLDNFDEGAKINLKKKIIIGLLVPVTFLLLCYIIYIQWQSQIHKVMKKMKKSLLRGMKAISEGFSILGIVIRQIRNGKKNPELQFFDFETIVSATNNFADECKLGKGGFGPVYKGTLADGQEVAIKRLSKSSGQGLEEFKNETILIAKLQHTNLVRLIGYCIYKEEKLLVYEYMPNKSLDSFLFDSEKKLILDWDKRLHIVQGIVQGLLYLHNYSRLRIIHRDLKVSNILLDDEMNAKISDFGMARVFKPSEPAANTSRVVGTHGYISPEYAMEGIFSIKSDVYSFGILLLEIITSKKNYNNYGTERPLNLIGYSWELWVNGRGEELIDSELCIDSEQKPKVVRCIHVSLLCVQQIAEDRPTMLDVYFMINNDSTQLPSPKQPAFFVSQTPHLSQAEPVESGRPVPAEPAPEIGSLGTMSVSVMVPR